MMAHHDLLLLTNAEKRSIKTHVTTYEQYNPDTVETAYDGPKNCQLFSNNAPECSSQRLQQDWIHEGCYLGKMQ